MSLKSVEKLIAKYGVSAFSNDTPFIKRKLLSNQNACDLGMPFCFYQQLEKLENSHTMWCFSVFLPHKKQKLAMYLVDKHNEIIEQVYYLRDMKSVKACDKIKKLLNASLSSANAECFTLAA